jgi:hypothetical protein
VILTKEVFILVLSVVVCAIGIFGLRFFRSDSEEGFTDKIGEGNSVHLGYTDRVRPDLKNRPDDGTFWSTRYTPVWLSRK